MRDDDDALAGIDLAAWQPPPPPANLADAVVARMRSPSPAAAIEPHERTSRRPRWIAGLAAAAVAIVAVTAWGLMRAPGASHGELIAARARQLELDGSVADLDAGAELRWDRERNRITVRQARGVVRWTVAGDDTLVIDTGGPGSAATIEASGASLRVEVQMNLSDVRLVGASAVTAAAVAVVTVVVYAGHVKATSGGQTVNVTPGATVELRPQSPPQEPAPPRPETPPRDPVVVGASPADVHELEDRLRAADERIAALSAALAASSQAVDVAPKVLEGLRLDGQRDIPPDDATKTAIAKLRDPTAAGTFKLCIDATGAIASVKLVRSTRFAAYDQAIEQAMHGWTYRPFLRDGRPTPACTEVRFAYRTAAPPPVNAPPVTVEDNPPAAPGSACETMNVDDVLQKAALNYSSGFSATALALATKALACKHTTHMYRLATLYACAAHDLPAARLYFAKVPPPMQTALEQRCQQENLQLRTE